MNAAPRFPSALPSPEQLRDWAAGERTIFEAVQAERDERDRGLDMLGRGRRRRRAERLVGEGA
ncbi:hypothetical protein EAH89_17150 [Roseomonas nepalensis]|uniref:Uncharacterized protein n=1 Tax=Muricoccus nepalensis TaxID=1854500 RepID=A0A502FW25_9PROT|nr:hypothetical protein [Roseomonas nepalensis]TPG53246.1 hypothetical protein EAH89_17150 [Roseomonas nepalensis]